MADVALWVDSLAASPTGQSAQRARTLIVAFAERHIALTQTMADAFVRLEQADAPAEAPLWGAGFRLAGQAVGQAQILGVSRFWKAAVPCFRTTVAEPLLRRAMTQCEGVALQGFADLARPADDRVIDRWRSEYEAALSQLLTDFGAMGVGFWAEAAVRLHGAALHDVSQRRHTGLRDVARLSVPPEPEPLFVRLLFDSEPTLPDDFRLARRRQRSRSKSQRKRSGSRPKEGGVAGIQSSTFVDDLPDALLSELVLPPELVADRLLHEGILVRNRPPFREPRRDLLLIAMADRRSLAASDASTMIKAAWTDAALRLQITLSQMGLEKSDLVWSEANRAGLAAHALSAERAEFPAGLDPMLLEGTPLKLRVFKSDLMPGMADTLARQDGRASASSETLADLLPALAQSALRELVHRERLGRLGKPRADEPVPPRPADYARRLVFVILPSQDPLDEEARKDWTSVRSRFVGGLRSTLDESVELVGLLTPRDGLGRGAVFSVVGGLVPGGLAEIQVDPDMPANAALGHVMGALSARIIETVLEALDVR